MVMKSRVRSKFKNAARDGKIVNGMVPETFRKHVKKIIDKAKGRLRESSLNKP